MGYPLQLSNASLPLRFQLVLSSDHITGATAKTPAVTIAKNDLAGFITPAGSVTEIGNGWYQLNANATDANTVGPLSLHASASGCDPVDDDFLVVNYNPTTSTSSAVSTPGAVIVSDLINTALKRINVLQPGQVANPDQMGDALKLLNFMMDAWAAERLTMPFIQVTYWTLTSTKGTPTNPYTVGAGGDINVARPLYIDHINYQDNAQTPPLERPLTPLTRDAYAAIPLKTLTSPLPGAWYYQPTYTNNLGSLYLWMIPSQANLQGVMYAPSAVAQFGKATDTVILPPAYVFAIEENLAVILASTFRENLPPDPILVANARELKAALKRPNIELLDQSFDAALVTRRGVYSIFSDSQSGRP